jgi:cyclophilin family peptidyl-prolyl cis-trans isomerase
MRRRSVELVGVAGALLMSCCCAGPPSPALAVVDTESTSSTSSVGGGSSSYVSPDQAAITHKVFFDVRISRQDGTFYVRDDLPDLPENRVFLGRLVIGLFGKNAPNHVDKFLSYVTAANPLDDNPMPSYSRSVFTLYDQATGVLGGGVIPALELTELNGANVLKYGGRLIPASLWLERPGPDGTTVQRISHSARGLLTHKLFDVTPSFGITTRSDTSELDSTHTVFGRILLDDSSREFLSIVQDLPTYRQDRPVPSSGETTSVAEDAAQAVYAAQRNFFRRAAQTFGDARVDKVFEGKILRRVEVTQVGLI